MSESAGNHVTLNREIRPNPDPSSLTTDQILRETGWVNQLFQAKLDSIVSTLGAMEKALELVQSKADRQPSPREVQLQVEALTEVKLEHWKSIDKQIESITTLANQMSSSSKEAITAAFSAYKDAAAKSEDNLDKRITQQAEQSKTSMSVLDVTITGVSKSLGTLEGRVVAIESLAIGQTRQQSIQHTSNASSRDVVALVVGTLIGAVGLLYAILKP